MLNRFFIGAAALCLATSALADDHSAGDAKAGKRVFNKCKACHTLKEAKHKTGPSLFQVIGTNAGQVKGFDYSEAMTNSGLTWDVETLSAFLADPEGTVANNDMTFRGLKKPEDIANVIAYIRKKSE